MSVSSVYAYWYSFFTQNIELFQQGMYEYPANTYKDTVLGMHMEPMSLAGEEQALPLTMLGNLEEAGCILDFDKWPESDSILLQVQQLRKGLGTLRKVLQKLDDIELLEAGFGGVVLKQQLYWNGQGCSTMLDNIGQGGKCIYHGKL